MTRYQKVLVFSAIVTALILINALFTWVQMHQGCSPGPRPYGWNNDQWHQYATTICSGLN